MDDRTPVQKIGSETESEMKFISSVIVTPVTMLFNRSLAEGSVPLDWKLTNVSPIFKQGSRHSAENYRPISLTCHLSKVLESIIRDQITNHLNKFDLIHR